MIQMGCEEFFLAPWTLRSEAIVQEFLQPRSNKWEDTIRRDPERWTANLWAEVYSFRKDGRNLAARTNKYIDCKFSTSIDPKDGHAISNV